jgi:hypothetical protein
MHVPITSSIAGTIGFSSSREAKLQSTGPAADTSRVSQAAQPLEENTNVGDRDAQEQYQHDPSAERRRDVEKDNEPSDATLLELPADDELKHSLDVLG